MIHAVTHYDRTYEAQGRCMLESLRRHASERHIQHIVWCDDKSGTCDVGNDKSLRSVRDLRAWTRLADIKSSRSRKEWFWSIEPAIVDHFLNALQDGDILLYVDADSFFFADPFPAIRRSLPGHDETPLTCEKCVALSPHFFPVGHEHKERSVGKFNFGCAAFRACRESREIVMEWLDQTLACCSEGSAGDQIYLDQWPDKLGNNLSELPQSINCAPWQAPEIVQMNGNPMLNYGLTLGPLISFHFHEHRRGPGRNPVELNGEQWHRSGYELHPSTVSNVYEVYERRLSEFL